MASTDQCRHWLTMGSWSRFCLILHPHRVAVTFPPTFASPWWPAVNSWVQGKIWDCASKTTQKRPKLGRWVTFWYKNLFLGKPSFPKDPYYECFQIRVVPWEWGFEMSSLALISSKAWHLKCSRWPFARSVIIWFSIHSDVFFKRNIQFRTSPSAEHLRKHGHRHVMLLFWQVFLWERGANFGISLISFESNTTKRESNAMMTTLLRRGHKCHHAVGPVIWLLSVSFPENGVLKCLSAEKSHHMIFF